MTNLLDRQTEPNTFSKGLYCVDKYQDILLLGNLELGEYEIVEIQLRVLEKPECELSRSKCRDIY